MNNKITFNEEEQKAVSAIEHIFKVTFEIIQSEKRTKSAAFARQVFCYIFYHVFGYTFEEIGKMLDNRNHTTILKAVEQYKNDELYFTPFKKDIKSLKKLYNY